MIPEIINLKICIEDIEKMSYNDKCSLLNSKQVLVARHFQYRVEFFFKEIVIDGLFSKTKYYAIPIEFQVHQSLY